MKAEEMLEGMCRSDLTKADSRAICAARGFPSRYASSPDLLEHVFLSDTGVKEALDRLDRNQVLLLHLMNFMGEATDITFFTRIYPKTDMRWDGTFNKEHKEVFKRVKSDLIRKGILLFNTKPKYWGADTVLERQRFLFPREFAALLPPPLATRTIESPRIVPPKKDVLREKLGEILEMESKPDSRSMQGRLHIKDGCLLINKSAFSEKRLRSWNTARWMSSVKVNKRQSSEGISPAK
ncbi:MAG: hypothetical protein GY868_17300, partial [Deltaproteobacteria bacterium]|nr:hypothetical protein [Deltaproteobacteria bacterium]